MVTNNFDEPAFIYKNNANKLKNNYLRIKLVGPPGNLHGIGAKITIEMDGLTLFEEFKMTRGYLSSVEPIAHFGLGNHNKIEKIIVKWFDGKKTEIKGEKSN